MGGSFTAGTFFSAFVPADVAGFPPSGLVRCTGTLVAGGGLGGLFGASGLGWTSGGALSATGGVGGAALAALLGFGTGVDSALTASSAGAISCGVVLRARGFGAGFAEAEEVDLGELDPVVDSSDVSPLLFVRLGLRGLAGGSIMIVPPVPRYSAHCTLPGIPVKFRWRISTGNSHKAFRLPAQFIPDLSNGGRGSRAVKHNPLPSERLGSFNIFWPIIDEKDCRAG